MKALNSAVRSIGFIVGILSCCLIFIIIIFTHQIAKDFDSTSLIISAFITAVVTSAIIGFMASYLPKKPLKAIGDAILHVSPESNGPAPNLEKLSIGREYINTLAYNVYKIASLQDNKILAEHRKDATQAANILSHLPLPVYVFNKEQVVTFATEAGMNYVAVQSSDMFGKPLFDSVDLDFQNDFTLESWIKDCAINKATDVAYWRRVRVHVKQSDNKTIRQCDIAGYYNRDNPSGVEFIITLFDHTETYNKDESNMNYLALAVHELRTPLTVMRGYIEALEDEMRGKLDETTNKFMNRIQSSAKQLGSFVNNILNVARINEDQLSIKIAEENWTDIVSHAVTDMNILAKVKNIKINVNVAENLPTVGVDRMIIYEVLTNLIDNAIKYSGKSLEIFINVTLNSSGQIETLVQDKGVGIPASVIPTLFEKFHRNHRNKDDIIGTGLGLFISKAIVSAHGGEIWVTSKENEGTNIGFTVLQYSQLALDGKNGNNEGMVRTAHGWIKNHSKYRG